MEGKASEAQVDIIHNHVNPIGRHIQEEINFTRTFLYFAAILILSTFDVHPLKYFKTLELALQFSTVDPPTKSRPWMSIYPGVTAVCFGVADQPTNLGQSTHFFVQMCER